MPPSHHGRTLTFTRTGATAPVFLCPSQTGRHLVLVTPHEGMGVLEYTYDPPARIRNYPHSVAWIRHDVPIEQPFGECLFGHAVAVRLRVRGRNPHLELTIKPHPNQTKDDR